MMHSSSATSPTVIAIGAQVTALIAPCYVLFTLVEVLSAHHCAASAMRWSRRHPRWSFTAIVVSSNSGLRLLAQLQTSPLPSSTPSPGCSPASPFSFTISPANGCPRASISEKAARRAVFGPARNRRLTNFLPVFLVRNRKKRYVLPSNRRRARRSRRARSPCPIWIRSCR